MEFSTNSTFLYIVALGVILFVLAQSAFFLVRAYRRGKQLGITGWIPIFVLLVSALTMAICGLLIKKLGWKWLETYAMALCMVVAMTFAAVITPVLSLRRKLP